MKRLCLLLLLPVSLFAQNWSAQMYQTISTNDSLRVLGIPTNWPALWRDIGTNTTAASPFVFVGNATAKSNFIAARIGAYQNWRTNTYDPQDFLTQSNITFTITNNIATLQNLFTSNSVFLFTVQTNQAAVTTLTLSNQTVILSRLINRIGKMLQDQYRGD